MGVYDLLIRDIIDHETGKVYSALSCCNNQEMADRCTVPNAPKVIWSIKASSSFNSEICILLRNGFKNGKINLLISDKSCDEVLKEKVQNYSKLAAEDKMIYRLPYIQTSLLSYELINLTSEISGTNVKIKEKSGMRKDRYSSLAYNYWVQCQLEREVLRKPDYSMTMVDFATQLSQLNQAPIFY